MPQHLSQKHLRRKKQMPMWFCLKMNWWLRENLFTPVAALHAIRQRVRVTGPDWGGYSVDETAVRHGAGVEEDTNDPNQAYARFPRRESTRYRAGWLPD